MKPARYGAQRAPQQPDGAVRRSQMVTTFGPGSMVDLLHSAVLIGGLDFWSYDKAFAIPQIQEPRLREAVAERFRRMGRELSEDAPFRAPPAGNDREPSPAAGVLALEYPQWFVCQEPSCRALLRKDGLELKDKRYRHQCTRQKSGECVPVRFVMACKKGHLDEFPWIGFVHEIQRRPRCAAPSLTFEEGATGDFNEIRVVCACGGEGKLKDVIGGLQLHCRGERPWLGPEGKDECKEQARLLVRTATNSYFPVVQSALSIPDPAREVEERVQRVWDVIKTATREILPIFRQIEKVRVELDGIPDEDVLAAKENIASGKRGSGGYIRPVEYRQLTAAPPEVSGDLPPTGAEFFARTVTEADVPAGVRRLVVAPKLREVVAQIGFTRLEPITPDVLGEHDIGVEAAALGLTTNWLPASEVLGEGVFIELDEEAVRRWEDRDSVKERARALCKGHEVWGRSLDNAPPFPGARFYMLHTLAHLLMSAISLECGYAASAIRERIYCGPSARDPQPMAGILLSTGTSGTEGTLGGLVEQGRRLRSHLQRAFDMGRLCSNDPVCATHSPENDPSERWLEGAACHGCLFVAECSCERFNRYLDRALVVPSLGHPADLAFFSVRP